MARAGAQAATKEAARLIMQAKAQDKITIYGPKTDGTYLVEFRAADWAIARDLHSGKRSGRAAPFPGPDALWAGCAGCSVRNLSFPKIISAHSDDAIRTRLVW